MLKNKIMDFRNSVIDSLKKIAGLGADNSIRPHVSCG